MSEQQPTNEQEAQIEDELRDVDDDPELSVWDQLPWKVVVLVICGTAITITLILTGTNPLRLVTQEVMIIGLFVGLSSIFSAPLVISGIKSIWTPPRIFLFDIDAVEDGGLEPLAAHPSLARKLTVREGQIHKTEVQGFRVWVGRGFRKQENSIMGTWRGMADDLTLLNNEQEIRGNRGRLKYYARLGRELDAKFPTLIDSIQNAVWGAITSENLDTKAVDADAVRREVIKEIDSIETAEQPESVEKAVEAEMNKQVGESHGVDLDGGGEQ